LYVTWEPSPSVVSACKSDRVGRRWLFAGRNVVTVTTWWT
jgi:hypothetical protein